MNTAILFVTLACGWISGFFTARTIESWKQVRRLRSLPADVQAFYKWQAQVVDRKKPLPESPAAS